MEHNNSPSKPVEATSFGETLSNTIFLIFYAVYAYVDVLFQMIKPSSPKCLDNEIILITGSSSGIGREVALHLAKNHPKAKLVLWDFNESENCKTAEKVKSFGADVKTYTVDVTDKALVTKTAQKVANDVGDVTILFNNAGFANLEPLLETSEEKIEKVVQVNLLSHFWTLRAFLPKMIEQNHGHVVTTSSMSGHFGFRNDAVYSATKFAIRGYIESLRSELRYHHLKPTNVKFTTIFPWFVRTPMLSQFQLQKKFRFTSELLEPEYVASTIVDGIRYNQEDVVIPKSWIPSIYLQSFTPRKLQEKVEDLIT